MPGTFNLSVAALDILGSQDGSWSGQWESVMEPP